MGSQVSQRLREESYSSPPNSELCILYPTEKAEYLKARKVRLPLMLCSLSVSLFSFPLILSRLGLPRQGEES